MYINRYKAFEIKAVAVIKAASNWPLAFKKFFCLIIQSVNECEDTPSSISIKLLGNMQNYL